MNITNNFLTHSDVEKSMPTSKDKMLPWLRENYDRMLPDDRYQKTLEVYSMIENTANFPKKYLIGLKKIRPKDFLNNLPNELKGKNEIIVYRGTGRSEQINAARLSASWTIDRNVAIWFSQRFFGCGRLFSAKIEVDKIIAFLGGSEQEIIQHCGVTDVKEIILCQDEIDLAIKVHSEVLKNGFLWCDNTGI